MTDLNAFGNLTGISNYNMSRLKAFDVNNDGKIDEQEFKQCSDYFKELGWDTVNFEEIDINKKDGLVTENELIIAQKKGELQEVLNTYEGIIVQDGFTGEVAENIAKELVEFSKNFAATFNGKVADIVKEYEPQLAAKYNELKEAALQEAVEAKYDQAVEAAYERVVQVIRSELIEKGVIKEGDTSADDQIKFIAKRFFKLVNQDKNILNAAKTEDVEKLTERIIQKLNESDASMLSSKIKEAYSTIDELGSVITEKEASKYLKPAVFHIIQQALSMGIVLTVKGTQITTEAVANQLLARYTTDGEALQDIIKEIDDQLSEETYLEKLLAGIQVELDEAKEAENAAKVEEVIEKVLEFGDLEFAELKLGEVAYYGTNIEVAPGNIFHQLDRILNDGINNAKTLLQEEMEKKILDGVKTRCEKLGIPYSAEIENIAKLILGDAISQAAIDNCYLNDVFMTKNCRFNVGPAVDEVLKLFNENFSKIMKERLENNELIKSDTVDNSKVNITVGSGINVISKRYAGEAYSSQAKNQTYSLSDLLNGKSTMPLVLSEFDAGGNDFNTEKNLAKSNIKTLINDLGTALIAGGYDETRVKTAVATCLSYYNAAIDAMVEPSKKTKHTTRQTSQITYTKNGEQVTETVSYYGDNHAQDQNRVSRESAADNSTGLQVYRDGSGETDFFITVDLAKVAQTLYRFL